MSNGRGRVRASIALRRLATAVLTCIGLAFALRFAWASAGQLATPFDLQFETANLATVKLIARGVNPYDREVFDGPPFVFTLYTPLYYYLVAALPVAENLFLPGRMVGLLGMIGAALTVLLVPSPRAVAVCGMGLFLSLLPVIRFAAYLKNDSLALLFSAVAMALLHRARGRPAWIVAAAVGCLLGLATKQSHLAAPITGVLFLGLRSWREAAWFAAAGGVGGAAFLLFATLHWGEGFLFSTVVGATHPLEGRQLWWVVGRVAESPILLPGVGFVALCSLWHWRRNGAVVLRESPFLLYALVSVLLFVITVPKVGSHINYVLEPGLALVLLGVWTAPRIDMPRLVAVATVVILALLTVWDLSFSGIDRNAWMDRQTQARRSAHFAQIRREVRSLGLDDPVVVSPVIWDDLQDRRLFAQAKSFEISDRPALNDPFLYWVLWRQGSLDLDRFLESLRAHRFELVVLPERLRSAPRPFANPILETVARRYRVALEGRNHDYYVPRVNAEEDLAESRPPGPAPEGRAKFRTLGDVLMVLSGQRSMSIVQIGAYIGRTPNDPLYRFLHWRLEGEPAGAEWSHKIVLVEPIREYFEQLRENYARLPRVVLENVAIAETEGELEMYRLKADPTEYGYPEWLAQLSSLKKERMEELWDRYEAESQGELPPDRLEEFQRFYLENRVVERVKSMTLQQLLDRHGIEELDLLQLDTEGYDFEILETLDFQRTKPRFINYERVLLYEQEAACRKLLEDRGYRLVDWGQDTLAIRMD